WFPPDRMLTFAFCIPLLAAVGLFWLGRNVRRPWIVYPVAIVLIVLTALPTIRGWFDTIEYVSPEEVAGATLAGRIGATTPPGTPLVFVADDPDGDGLFLWSHVLNVARATVPPERAGDVVVFLGSVGDLLAGRPTTRLSEELTFASAVSFQSIPEDLDGVPVFVVEGFVKDGSAFLTPGLTRWSPTLATTVPGPVSLPAGQDELATTDAGAIVATTLGALVLLLVAGFGWAWWAFRDLPAALATGAAFGIAALTIAAFVVERVGLGLLGPVPAGLSVALAGGAGYGLALGSRRRR
ncbi:MAG TPA: hypothetical protein VF235_07920, partial [Actinomycetota bacterium]